jgi:hypothetical protein
LIEPELVLTDYRWHGCTPLFVRILWLFSYRRCVTVDRNRALVEIETRWLWFLRSSRSVAFARIERLVCEAQSLPTGFPLWRAFALDRPLIETEVAFYCLALKMRDSGDEIPLFTVLESLPTDGGSLERLAGDTSGPRIGDEGTTRLMAQLQDYLGLKKGRP